MKNKRTINYNITEHEFYYLAGVIDASSSFCLMKSACGRKNKETGKKDLRWVGGFMIMNANPTVVNIVKKILFLGDSYTHISDMKSSNNNRRVLKSIRVFGPILDHILPTLIKILKVKKEHAEIVLEFRKSVSMKYNKYDPVPVHVQQERIILKNRINYLNSNEYKDIAYSPLLPKIISKEQHD